MSKRYILDGKRTVKVDDIVTWARAFENLDRIVRNTTVGDSEVSTIFLGLDHQYGNGPPLLFETMVFDGPMDGHEERYGTWDEAVAGHKAVVAAVEANNY